MCICKMSAINVIVFLFACLACIHADCGVAPQYRAGETTTDSVKIQHLKRTFHVHVPANYDQNKPSAVIITFHGGTSTGSYAEQRYKIDELAEQYNFITVYPDGYMYFWNAGPACCGPPSWLGIDDVGFVSSMIEVLKQKLCINPKRVFATGMSAGAVMSYTLACKLPDKISGIAIVEGSFMTTPCNITRPISTLIIHGTNDKHIPFYGGPGCGGARANWTSVPNSLNAFSAFNKCSCKYGESCGASVVVDDATCTSYGPCASNSSTTLCVVDKGGHAWSGSSFRGKMPGCDMTVGKFNASKYLVNFFLAINN